MASEAGRLGARHPLRALAVALSHPSAFPLLVLATFVALYVNVVSGALVRVTNSGLGCPDWPGCTAGRPVPAFAGHQLVEFSNRLLALVVVLLAVLCALAGRRSAASRFHTRLALAVGLVTLAQIPLGGLTVLFDLNPLLVMSHFLLAIADVAIATVLVIDIRGGPVADARPGWAAPAALAFACWTAALIVSGAVTTMSSTHPGADDVPRLWNLLDATYWHVRVGVSFVCVLTVVLWLAARLPGAGRRLARLGWAVVALTALQITIGELQWRNQLRWWMVLAHVSVAAALWATAIAFARTLSPRLPHPRMRSPAGS